MKKLIMKRLITFLVATAMVQMFAGAAFGKDDKPVASLTLSEGQVALGVGWSWGKGTLNFKGKSHSFKVEGLSLGDVGITKATATGKVFKLTNLTDFNGTYVSAAAEATFARGAGATAMKNEHGVVIHLYPKTKGLNLKLAAEGVKFTLQGR